MKVRMISLLLTALLPVPAFPMRFFSSQPKVELPKITSPAHTAMPELGGYMQEAPSWYQKIALPSLPLPSLQQQKNLILIGGGAILAIAIAAIAYKLWSNPVTQLNQAIALTTKELQQYFKALQLFESPDWQNLYGWFSADMKFLKQYDIPASINLTDKNTVIKHVLANNKKMQKVEDIINQIDPEFLDDAGKTTFINCLNEIIYQIAWSYNYRIKDVRNPVYRFVSKPSYKTQFPLDQKNKFIIPLLTDINKLNTFLTQLATAATSRSRINKKIEFSELSFIAQEAQKVIGTKPLNEVNVQTFLDNINKRMPQG